MVNRFYSSVCRISDLRSGDFDVDPVPFERWRTGDYVVGRVIGVPDRKSRLENPEGRFIRPGEADRIVGSLGHREATRKLVGDWREVPESGRMDLLVDGGVMGRATSVSPYEPRPTPLQYEGHVLREEATVNMDDFVEAESNHSLKLPVVLLVGTSMSSGKTTASEVMIRALDALGLSPAACKLTGVGRYQDILRMRDAGARQVVDFVDAGFPTTVVSRETFRSRLPGLLGRIDAERADVLVVELGASPAEPYNGDVARDVLADQVEFTALTATDPYAVLGFQSHSSLEVDLVTGITANTTAGTDLVESLTGIPTINMERSGSYETVKSMLRSRFEQYT